MSKASSLWRFGPFADVAIVRANDVAADDEVIEAGHAIDLLDQDRKGDFAGLADELELPPRKNPKKRVCEALRDGWVVAVRDRAAGVGAGGAAAAASTNVAASAPEVLGPEDHDVEFLIADDFEDPHTGLEWVLLFPDGQTKSGKLGASGRVNQSSVPAGGYTLSIKLVSDARWSDAELEVGKRATLSASAGGYAPGTSGQFEVFDFRDVDQDPIAKANGKVTQFGMLEAEWTPTDAAAKRATSGQVVFRASVGASKAMSPAVPLFAKLSLDLKDDAGALADTQVIAHFDDGLELSGDTKDGKLDLRAPAGAKLLWVDLPSYPGSAVTLTPDGEKARSYVLEDSDDADGGDAASDAAA
jgi:hypothetical protein